MGEAPAGACILYCVSCNLSDRDLVDAFDLLAPSGGTSDGDEEEEADADGDAEMAEGTSSTFKLKPWNKRKRPGLGYNPVVRSPRNTLNTRKGADTNFTDYRERKSLSSQFASHNFPFVSSRVSHFSRLKKLSRPGFTASS
ncbi:MAG: hypothetical protein D4R57_00075 [Verrucomicrobiales bacterium]|nr:MAG: hypothetical protein D4R57_00075 [Verrucomicrobiales bacterium]